MLTLHTFDNTYDDGQDYHQFLQRGRQPLLNSEALASNGTLRDFLVLSVIEDCIGPSDLSAENQARFEKLLHAVLETGDINKLLTYAERINMRDHPAEDDATITRFGEWTYDSLVIEPPTLREMQEDVWASDPLFTREEWKGEVHRNETHLGYWEWVEHQREMDDTTLVIRNANNGLFWDNENGWTSFELAMRFIGHERYKLHLPLEGEWVTEEEALPWKVGAKVLWTDPDNGICTRTGVLSFIGLIGPGHLAIVMEDGWEAEVNVAELSFADPPVILRFKPQAWQRDYAIPVDPEGPVTWRVPMSTILSRFKDEDEWHSKHEERDSMRFEGDAPKWIRDWSGPFEVELDDDEPVGVWSGASDLNRD